MDYHTSQRPPSDSPVILFDWGETLFWVPGMIHTPQRHLACVERIFAAQIRPHLPSSGIPLSFEQFLQHYLTACKQHIALSRKTLREHSFAERFASALKSAGVAKIPDRNILSEIGDALGREVVSEARPLGNAVSTIKTLARDYRLGVVSNYPHDSVVKDCLDRFGIGHLFSVIVVSAHTGRLKPHPDCFLPALAALPAPAHRVLMVGDDLINDIKGAKALGLNTAWLAPPLAVVDDLDADVDICLGNLAELPLHCEHLFA